jgi:hypothetical protein
VSVATQEIISNAECDPLVEQMAPAIDAALAFIIGTMLKRRQQNMEWFLAELPNLRNKL